MECTFCNSPLDQKHSCPGLRYDGCYEDMPGENRSWTLMRLFIDANGKDRNKGSFGLDSLIKFGIVK